MTITEVRIKLAEANNERLMAFCSITLDNAFCIRDLKIIGGSKGLFVSMPSRKLADRCPRCGGKNHLRARFCNNCGGKLDEHRGDANEDGSKAKHFSDVAHPVTPICRQVMEQAIVAAYHAELERSTQPGYVSSFDDHE